MTAPPPPTSTLVRELLADPAGLDAVRGRLAKLGVYQEAGGEFLVRVRLHGALATAEQLRVLADASDSLGAGRVHVTSRQAVQVHHLPREAVAEAVEALAAADLRGEATGGDALRGVAVCAFAGVCPHEAFDPTEAAQRLGAALLPEPESADLPRKLKVAFSGCARDCAAARANDIGFLARMRGGEPGFVVLAGGGLGARCRLGEVLLPWLPASRALDLVRAVREVFREHGRGTHRREARLRFLVERTGLATFRAWCRERLPDLAWEADAPDIAAGGAPQWEADLSLRERGGRTRTLLLPLNLGDVDSGALRAIASVAERLGEGAARALATQNLALRGIPEERLDEAVRELRSLPLAWEAGPIEREMVVCRGTPICRRGICRSSELAARIVSLLRERGLDPVGRPALRVHVSGCVNGCARNALADVGFYGVRTPGAEADAEERFMAQRGGSVAGLARNEGIVTVTEAAELVARAAAERG